MKAVVKSHILILLLLVGCVENSSPSDDTSSKIKVDITYSYNLTTLFKTNINQDNITNVTWEFGDGYQGKGSNVQHQYLSPGNYQASLHYNENGASFEQIIDVKLSGDKQSIYIQPQYSIAIDSDHNDPNQSISNNDTEPQVINTPVSVSGILLAKNSCQAGRLCDTGDYRDLYSFHLNYGDSIRVEVIKGAINLELKNTSESIIHGNHIQSEFVIPNHMLNEGQYTLDLELAAQSSKAQYIFHIIKLENTTERNFQPGKLIVVWDNSNTPELLDISDPRLASLETSQGEPNLPQARSLLNTGNKVKSVSLNYYRNAYSSKNTSWSVTQQRVDDLWGPLLARGHLPGKNTTIAILDTGIYFEHENLKGANFQSGYDFVSDPINSGDNDGWDDNPSDPGDSSLSYHGTHVTGIIAAQPSNQSQHIKGIAWNSTIMPLRVLGKNGGTSYDLIQALRYAAGLPNDSQRLPSKPADIINLSLGGSQFSVAEQATIHEVIKSGAVIVAASGNQGSSKINFPAAYKDVIAVGATDISGDVTAYSNTGAFIDLVAPGGHCDNAQCLTGINSLSAYGSITEHLDTRQSSWKNMSGTSMASAHVSGLLAIVRSHLPSLDSYELIKLIKNSSLTDNMYSTGFNHQSGWGKLSSQKLLNLIDTSNLDSSNAWVSKSDLFLKAGQTTDLPIIIRGDITSNQLTVSYNESELDVQIHDSKLTIKALTSFTSPQKIQLSINGAAITFINVSPNFHTTLPQYIQHLYLEMSGEGIQHTGLRTITVDDIWKANTPPLVTGQIIQASSDIDYDGVYCEIGEFCAYSQYQYSVYGSSGIPSSETTDNLPDLMLNGALLGY